MKLQKTDKRIYQNLLQGEFGIEKESLRITADGRLAATAHPFGLNERISRDFSEGQVEFISGVYNNLEDACNEICSLQWEVEQAIVHRSTGDEYMWTYSNPPLFEKEASIRIAEFAGSREEKTTYREYLAQKYGKVKMLFSGVHLNYSMPKAFFALLQEKIPDQPQGFVKSEWYVQLCDILMSDSWLIVALTSASPAADPFFFTAAWRAESRMGGLRILSQQSVRLLEPISTRTVVSGFSVIYRKHTTLYCTGGYGLHPGIVLSDPLKTGRREYPGTVGRAGSQSYRAAYAGFKSDVLRGGGQTGFDFYPSSDCLPDGRIAAFLGRTSKEDFVCI